MSEPRVTGLVIYTDDGTRYWLDEKAFLIHGNASPIGASRCYCVHVGKNLRDFKFFGNQLQSVVEAWRGVS